MMSKSFYLAKALKFFRLTSGILITKVSFVKIHNQILSNCLQETFEILKSSDFCFQNINGIPSALISTKFKLILTKFSCFFVFILKECLKKFIAVSITGVSTLNTRHFLKIKEYACLKCQANIDITEFCIEPTTVLQTPFFLLQKWVFFLKLKVEKLKKIKKN